MRLLLLLVSGALVAGAEPVTFLRDIAPILNKTGCTSGPCHGAAKGKKLHDKRQATADRDAKRDIQRALRDRG